MNKVKKIVLLVLLFTFAFITVHDHIIVGLNADVTHELSYSECEDAVVDLKSHVHDGIHTLLYEPIYPAVSIALVFPYQKQLEIKDFFVSQIVSVPQRPPLS